MWPIILQLEFVVHTKMQQQCKKGDHRGSAIYERSKTIFIISFDVQFSSIIIDNGILSKNKTKTRMRVDA